MSQQSLADLLKTIQKDYSQQVQDAADGIAPGGNWDTDLPVNLEYRALVTAAEVKASKSSGREQIVITYEIQEPSDYAGSMLQQYVDPNPTQTWQFEQVARNFGALGADVSLADQPDEFVKTFIGNTVVLTVEKWGEAMDRNGVRYINADKGQALKTNVQPKKGARTAATLRPDITIPKDPEPAQQPSSPAPAPSAPLPGAAQSTAVNLPPGLR